ncbi:unnamed protein product [Coccothraustes coccothraustes]
MAETVCLGPQGLPFCPLLLTPPPADVFTLVAIALPDVARVASPVSPHTDLLPPRKPTAALLLLCMARASRPIRAAQCAPWEPAAWGPRAGSEAGSPRVPLLPGGRVDSPAGEWLKAAVLAAINAAHHCCNGSPVPAGPVGISQERPTGGG